MHSSRPDRFHAKGAKIGTRKTADEIAMNPQHIGARTDRQTLSTLAHEMVHLWQHHFGKPGRRGYHNAEWAAKMDSLGPPTPASMDHRFDATIRSIAEMIAKKSEEVRSRPMTTAAR